MPRAATRLSLHRAAWWHHVVACAPRGLFSLLLRACRTRRTTFRL